MKKYDIKTRPIENRDIPALENYRRNYWEGDLEIPHGYLTENVETAVAESPEGNLLGSLTGILSVVLDPFIHDPELPPEIAARVLERLEQIHLYLAKGNRAVDIYIAVPDSLTHYHEFLKKRGYQPTVANCTVFRKPLVPDVVPLLGAERDLALKLDAANIVASTNDTSSEIIIDKEVK